MPETAVRAVDFEAESDQRNIAKMDDVTLLYVMLGLNGEMEGAPNWGNTPKARTLRRMVFTEIAARWIPPAVFGAAFRMLYDEEEASDV